MKSKKSYFNLTVFKKNITRFWPLWAGYFVLWLILLPLQGLTSLRLEANNPHPGVVGYMEDFANILVPDWAGLAWIFALIFGVLAAMAVFSHLYSARSANLFGSLPIRREGLFLTHYLAGLLFSIVPNVVIFLLTLIVEAAGGCVNMAGLLFWLGVTCGECFFFYSLAVFCGMFTGHILALPAFYGIVNVLAYGIYYSLYIVLETFYYGFAGMGAKAGEVMKMLTPAWALQDSVRHSWAHETWLSPEGDVVTGTERVRDFFGLDVVAGYVLAAVVLAVCAFFLYRARRLESAGDVVSVRPMRPVFKYGVAFCVGLVFGYATSFFVGGGEAVLIVAVLIWGVIGYFAAQMLLDKSFKVFRRWKGAVAVIGVFAVLFLVVGFDLTGYETRVPNADDVQSVYVRGLSCVRFSDNGDQVYLEIDDPDQVALLVALHQAAVDQRDQTYSAEPYAVAIDSSGPHTTTVEYSTTCSTWVKLTYTMKDGSELSRDYAIRLNPAEIDQEGTAAWAMEQLYHDQAFYWRVYGFDALEEELAKGRRLESVEFRHYDEYQGSVGEVVGYGVEAQGLLKAVEADLMAGRIGVRTLTDTRAVQRGTPLDSLVFRLVEPESGAMMYSVEIALQETATDTLANLNVLRLDQMDSELIRDVLVENWLR